MENKAMKDTLVESYEDLRDSMVSHKTTVAPPQGLALFLRRGMPGWIEAWLSQVLDNPITVRPQPLGVSTGCREPVPAEAAAILANMALAAIRREDL